MVERFVYEVRPFAYLAGAFAAQAYDGSAVMNIFVGLLMVCSGTVIYWRYQYRYVNAGAGPGRRR